MEPQLEGAMPVVRFVADPGGCLHGGGLAVTFLKYQAFARTAIHSASSQDRFSRDGDNPKFAG